MLRIATNYIHNCYEGYEEDMCANHTWIINAIGVWRKVKGVGSFYEDVCFFMQKALRGYVHRIFIIYCETLRRYKEFSNIALHVCLTTKKKKTKNLVWFYGETNIEVVLIFCIKHHKTCRVKGLLQTSKARFLCSFEKFILQFNTLFI